MVVVGPLIYRVTLKVPLWIYNFELIDSMVQVEVNKPSIYINKGRVWLKYRKSTLIEVRLSAANVNYAILNEKYHNENMAKILHSFKINIVIMKHEKKKYMKLDTFQHWVVNVMKTFNGKKIRKTSKLSVF